MPLKGTNDDNVKAITRFDRYECITVEDIPEGEEVLLFVFRASALQFLTLTR